MKRCVVCGMEANTELKREFEGETYYFHTGLCMVTFEIQLERIIAERNRLLEESRRSLQLSRFYSPAQLDQAVMAHRQRVHECACNTMKHREMPDQSGMNNGGYNDHV